MKKKAYIYFKSTFDILFAALLLVVLSPIMLLASLAVKLDSRGPVFFRQKRPGKGGRVFTIAKFRTMRTETEADGEQLSDMARMTRVGKILRKTSVDELPQLFNILMGDMSFIGPRPLLVQYLQHYSPEQMRRHEVKPGISGWAQVNGRNAIDWEEKFKLDVWYVDHMSFVLDLKILFLTIYNVFKTKGINQTRGNTMEQFRGIDA